MAPHFQPRPSIGRARPFLLEPIAARTRDGGERRGGQLTQFRNFTACGPQNTAGHVSVCYYHRGLQGEHTKMLKILSGVALAALTATAAFAADLPLKAPAAAPVKFTWTGCFIGGHVGGVVREDRSTNLLGASANFNSTGFVGGGQIGCDY